MESVRIQNKVKLLFEKLSQPNYVMNSYYADSFINKISNTSDPETANLIGIPFLRDLVIDALQNTDTYHNTVNVFLGRILAIVAKKEQHFNKILERREDKLLEFYTNIDSNTVNPSLKVAYLEVAIALATHNSGVSWILKTELWKKILSLYEKPGTIFVVRLIYKFASEFLWKMEELDYEKSLGAVLAYIAKPLLELDFSNKVYFHTPEKEEEYCKTFEPVLQILFNTLQAKNDQMKQKNMIMSILLKDICLPPLLYVFSDRIRKENMVLLTMKLLFSVYLLKVFQTKPYLPGVTYVAEDFVEVQAAYFNMIHYLIQRGNVVLVVDYCNNCNMIWRSYCKNFNIVLTTDDKNGKLQNQMLFIYVVPLLVYIKSCKGASIMNERINEYITTFVHTSCEHTARAAYALRDLVMEQDTLNVIFHSVRRLTFLRDHLNDTQANLLFKALFFVVCDYDPTQSENGNMEMENLEDSEQKVLVMTYIMDTILSLVKHYNIKWHASLEVICLNTVVHNILTKRPNLTCKFVVAALGVMTMTVKKFLPPNLSLLMDSQPGSAMHEIGKLIFVKMHDMHWEVRDSALELLHVCTEISYIKFPPIQKKIIENNLIPVAATIAFNDHEPYVQVSALKCVGAACKIASMWEQLKAEHPNLLEQLTAMLCNNQEGIVRKEACNVLSEVYQNIKLSPSFKQTLYEHMASSAMSDFHWEVQMSALKFWKIVIQSFLTDQGWLDGTFPKMTFARESRKIITLNDVEIRKRLLRVLDDLAAIGCLTVLLKLLHEDTEVEVLEAALGIAEELQAILHQYKVPEIVVLADGEPKSMAELVCHIKEDEHFENGGESGAGSSTQSDNVIEGILKADDMNLLASIYQERMNLDTPGVDDVSPKVKLVKAASPYLFVHYMDFNDCKNVIKQKKEWKEGIRSISSLLDDVLGLYESNEEANSLDCY